MNSSQTETIKLLIIDSSLNDAEAKVSTLRNAGLAIHSDCVTEKSDIFESLESNDPDLILLLVEQNTPGFTDTLKLCLRARQDSRLIVIYQKEDSTDLIQAMRDGARDVVSGDDPDHLQLVVKREFHDLQICHQLAQAQEKLREAEERCSALIASSRDAIAYIHEGMHMHANQIYLDMFGYLDMDEIEGLPILDTISSKDHKRFKLFLRTLKEESCDLMVKCQSQDGETFKAKLEFSPATFDGEPCTQIIIRDYSENRELEHKLELLSNQDPLTGLANHQYFMGEIEQHIITLKKSNCSCSLLYLSIDEFQKIRTTVGIVASDRFLQELAKPFQDAVTEGDIIARFGDHTFTILSDKCSASEIETLVEQLRTIVGSHNCHNGDKPGAATCSIGIALLGDETENSQEFINHAYQACVAAKEKGGNEISFYNAGEMVPNYGDDNTGDEVRINKLIQHALEKDRFRMVFQPIVSLQGDSRENYAVLTRLLDNHDNEIQPNYFTECAEQNEQMLEIDRWVIKHAIIELTKQRAEKRKVNFFISLSASSIQDEGTLLWVCDCLRNQKAKGAWLTFQIKDKDVRNHTQSAKKLVDGLKRIKCQIAIDQFGSNQKAETLLKHLLVDYVKFDVGLIEELATTQGKQDRLNELNALALSHSIRTIAMGIEDANSLAILWTVGVNYIQGYFLQGPAENIGYEFTPH
ncbi:MAG: EAL domain-containing protein [Sedimenticolaceae bacterium]